MVLKAAHRLAATWSSASAEWYTPPAIIEAARAVLGTIDLDPASCAEANQTVQAGRYYTKEHDGLLQPWAGRVYLNPPFGDALPAWMERLDAAYQAGDVTAALALAPARVDTKWWFRMRAYPVCFLAGRLKFSGAANSAPFPCAVFYLGDDLAAFVRVFGRLGLVYQLAEGMGTTQRRSAARQGALALEVSCG